MTDIKTMLETLGMDVDEETLRAIREQLDQDKENAAQASAVHVDI
ncbi:MAG: hypothetical protein V6Z89_12045 [Desulfobacter sp.]